MVMWPVTSLLAHLWHLKRANERQLPTNTVGTPCPARCLPRGTEQSTRPHRKTPMELDRIYTRSGDDGRTSLGDGAPSLRSRFHSEAFIQCKGRSLRRDAETAPRAAKRRPGP